jgi:hypothetical protein
MLSELRDLMQVLKKTRETNNLQKMPDMIISVQGFLLFHA